MYACFASFVNIWLAFVGRGHIIARFHLVAFGNARTKPDVSLKRISMVFLPCACFYLHRSWCEWANERMHGFGARLLSIAGTPHTMMTVPFVHWLRWRWACNEHGVFVFTGFQKSSIASPTPNKTLAEGVKSTDCAAFKRTHIRVNPCTILGVFHHFVMLITAYDFENPNQHQHAYGYDGGCCQIIRFCDCSLSHFHATHRSLPQKIAQSVKWLVPHDDLTPINFWCRNRFAQFTLWIRLIKHVRYKTSKALQLVIDKMK